MARLTYDSPMRSQSANPIVDLDRVLNRLQQTILRADAERERRLRTSEYERQKVGFNIDYARTLLTRMEQEAVGVKIYTRKQEMQADLNRKRDLLDQVMDRMRDLEELSAQVDDDDASSEGDDILGEIIATPSESMDSRSTDMPGQDTGEDDVSDNIPKVSEQREPRSRAPAQRGDEKMVETLEDVISEKPGTVTSQTLRPRGHQSVSDPEKQPQDLDTAQTTASTTAKSLLLGNRSKEVSDISTSEAILDHQRKTQDEMTEDLLKTVRQLKLSSQRFGEDLQQDTEVLTRAGEGLNKNELSMEAAARRMGALTKMTEGKGWWGRIMLYAWIYGLMVVLVLVVLVLPKLRF